MAGHVSRNAHFGPMPIFNVRAFISASANDVPTAGYEVQRGGRDVGTVVEERAIVEVPYPYPPPPTLTPRASNLVVWRRKTVNSRKLHLIGETPVENPIKTRPGKWLFASHWAQCVWTCARASTRLVCRKKWLIAQINNRVQARDEAHTQTHADVVAHTGFEWKIAYWKRTDTH